MKNLVQNYINGNLTDAKRLAKDRPYTTIRLSSHHAPRTEQNPLLTENTENENHIQIL